MRINTNEQILGFINKRAISKNKRAISRREKTKMILHGPPGTDILMKYVFELRRTTGEKSFYQKTVTLNANNFPFFAMKSTIFCHEFPSLLWIAEKYSRGL